MKRDNGKAKTKNGLKKNTTKTRKNQKWIRMTREETKNGLKRNKTKARQKQKIDKKKQDENNTTQKMD